MDVAPGPGEDPAAAGVHLVVDEIRASTAIVILVDLGSRELLLVRGLLRPAGVG